MRFPIAGTASGWNWLTRAVCRAPERMSLFEDRHQMQEFVDGRPET
jgi:hypothetical protein